MSTRLANGINARVNETVSGKAISMERVDLNLTENAMKVLQTRYLKKD